MAASGNESEICKQNLRTSSLPSINFSRPLRIKAKIPCPWDQHAFLKKIYFPNYRNPHVEFSSYLSSKSQNMAERKCDLPRLQRNVGFFHLVYEGRMSGDLPSFVFWWSAASAEMLLTHLLSPWLLFCAWFFFPRISHLPKCQKVISDY